MRARKFALISLGSLAFTTAALTPALAAPESFPAHALTLVVPFTAGGVTDTGARLVARKLAEILDSPVVVENKPGAGGNVAAGMAAKAKPDGYTLFMGTQGTQASNQYVYKSIGFDPARDFTPVHGVLSVPNVIVIRADQPYKTLGSLVAAAQAQPDKLNYASPGNGTGAHLAAELFQSASGAKFTHVPYRGSAPAVTDLLGGSVDIAFDYASSTMAHIRAGTLRALAVTGAQRLQALPDVPTLGEQGYGEAQATSWAGIFVPAATPAETTQVLRHALREVMGDPEIAATLDELGAQVLPMDQAQFNAYVAEEQQRWKAVVEKSNAKVE